MDNYKWFDDFLYGKQTDSYKYFGAHFIGKDTVKFTVYAPMAKQINVLGSFNSWSCYGSEMKKVDYRGLFELVVNNVKQYDDYKYHVLGCDDVWRDKADPFAFFSDLRPSNNSRVFSIDGFNFEDDKFIKERTRNFDAPMSIYEIHLGSWLGMQDGRYLSYEEIAPKLIKYVQDNGFTHVEIMPITQYPFDGSWGYQVTGYYSVDSRYGNPLQLMSFVNQLHKAGIGVILDFVPVHFAVDDYALNRFDGSCVYEYAGEHEFSQWGTKNFDLGKDLVRSFLISSMCYFIDNFHFDGIRIDAVSNIIYFDGNSNNGINQGGVDFIKRATYAVHDKYKTVMMIAEDSSSYGMVTKGFSTDGLGFDYKWDLGWMNDTLKYYAKDPIYKPFHHNQLTFSMAYFYSENFLLPLSHDEVVHGKGTIINKMFGDYETKFALVRNLYAYQFAHPGKKLNFMGNELASFDEWNEKRSLTWKLKEFPKHDSISRLFRDLNLIYRNHKAMYMEEYNPLNFRWIMVDNNSQSMFIFKRSYKDETLIFIFNMTPNYYRQYDIGVPYDGKYEEIFNSEKGVYSGCDQYNGLPLQSRDVRLHNQPCSITLQVASYSAIFLRYIQGSAKDGKVKEEAVVADICSKKKTSNKKSK